MVSVHCRDAMRAPGSSTLRSRLTLYKSANSIPSKVTKAYERPFSIHALLERAPITEKVFVLARRPFATHTPRSAAHSRRASRPRAAWRAPTPHPTPPHPTPPPCPGREHTIRERAPAPQVPGASSAKHQSLRLDVAAHEHGGDVVGLLAEELLTWRRGVAGCGTQGCRLGYMGLQVKSCSPCLRVSSTRVPSGASTSAVPAGGGLPA